MTRPPSSADTAKARIMAIRHAARELSIKTGGDPAEAVYEFVCAAILILQETRPTVPVADLISQIAPNCAITVENWFSDDLKAIRRGNA